MFLKFKIWFDCLTAQKDVTSTHVDQACMHEAVCVECWIYKKLRFALYLCLRNKKICSYLAAFCGSSFCLKGEAFGPKGGVEKDNANVNEVR